jgi:hypothetical protein
MRTVRITKVPNMAYGGKVFNQIAPNALPDHVDAPKHKVKKVLEPTSRDAANIEAEKGETAFILNEDGLPAHYKIGGKRHSEGGTPLNVPEDTFIFSDTKGMIIKDPQILAQFGETKPKTPAKIAEKYDMNQYRKVLSDKDTDDLQRQTAEKMIENYTMLLGKLALVQESSKGFPQGIPMISQPYMIMNNIKPEDILPKPADQQAPPQPEFEEAEAMEDQPMPPMAMFGYEAPPMLPPTYFANGGSSRGRMVRVVRTPQYSYGGSLPKAQDGSSGRGGRQDTYDYVSAWAQQYLENSKKGNYATELPPTMTDPNLRTRVKVQGAIAGYKGAFGDREIIDNFGEFKKRHNWFFKDYPDLTIEDFLKNHGIGKGGLIEKFQQAYNAKAAEYGLPEYFTKDGPEGTKYDAVYGEHTYSAPGFNPAPPKEEIPETTPEPAPENVEVPDVEMPKGEVPYAWFPQDIINLGVAASTKIPRMKTFYEPLQFRTPDVAYLRENYNPYLAAEQTGVQGALAYAQKPGAFAMTSALAGKTAEEAAKHNLDIANLNAEKYDKASLQAATVANANAEYNSKLRMQDYDARQLYERDRVMAQNKKRAEIAKAINTGITNAASIYNLNQINQQYAIDPRGGGLVTYVNPKMINPDEDALMDAKFQEFKMWQANTDLSDDQIISLMKAKDDGVYNNTSAFVNPYEYAAASARSMYNQNE